MYEMVETKRAADYRVRGPFNKKGHPERDDLRLSLSDLQLALSPPGTQQYIIKHGDRLH